MMIFCSTRASGTVYTAIDIATGQEVGQIPMMMKQHADAVYHFFVLANQTCSSFSGGHQADEPAAAAQERADHQWDSGDEGKQKLQYSELPRQVSLAWM